MYKSTRLQIDFTIESSFDVHFGTLHEIFITDAELYKGDYAAKPKFTEQKLPTKNKLLTDDVSVMAIEVQRVSNTSGGRTVYIGGLING